MNNTAAVAASVQTPAADLIASLETYTNDAGKVCVCVSHVVSNRRLRGRDIPLQVMYTVAAYEAGHPDAREHAYSIIGMTDEQRLKCMVDNAVDWIAGF